MLNDRKLVQGTFSEVPAKTHFYTPRHQGSLSDSIHLYKEESTDESGWSPDWGELTLAANTPCSWLVYL